MSKKSEYQAAKREYHKLGKALFNASGSKRTALKKEYHAAKKEYHHAGNALRKGR